MNTTTPLRFAPSRLSIAACTASLMVLQSIAAADPPTQQPAAAAVEKRTAAVSLADLDLSTPQGVQAARERLHQAARQLCSQLEDSHDLGHQPHFVACVDAATAAAWQRLQGPAVAAVDGIRAAGHPTR